MDTKKLRQKILDLAIRGKLVPQNPNDEPASVLLERIRAEKEQLIKEGKIKRSKKSVTSDTSHYENVPFEVPGNWCWVKVADISSVIVYGVSESAKSEGKFKLLRITDIQDNAVNWNTVPYTDYPESKSENYILQAGDILFARTGATVGKSYLVDDAVPENAIYASYLIKVRVSNMIIPQYVKYFFESGFYWEQIANNSVGVGQPNVNGSCLGNLWVPIPPIQEQRRIVDKLVSWCLMIDKISVNQELITQQIEELRNHILNLAISGKLVAQEPSDEPAIELLKRINPMFSPADNRHYENTKITIPRNWCWVKLGEIFDVVSAKRVFQSEWQKTGIPFYRAREIVKLSNCGHVDNELYISIEHFESLKNKYGAPEADDIMLSAVGTIGKCYIVNKNDRFYYKDASVLCLKNIYNLNSEYIKFVLDSSVVQMQMQDQSKGTTVDTITIEKAKGYYIPLPPVTEQSRIVKAITLINHTIDKIAAIL